MSLLYGCILASIIIRKSSKIAFDIDGYGLTTPHILEKVGMTINNFAKNVFGEILGENNSKL